MEIDMEKAVRTYGDMVLRLAVVNTNNRSDAEDVFQEVFLKLLRYKESITSEEHLKAWLIRVTINQSHSHTTSFWNKFTGGFSNIDDLQDGSAINELFNKETVSDLTKAIMKIPLKYRRIIHLYYYEEFSIKEISEILGESENTIKTRLARGRKLLKIKMGEAYGI
ncbi:MAG: sigma-70 family RNA polymerase sigma factor [Lachnospiraceae bacterium]|nr:sigma-70 family RNA polymerase sigma factor [Lachnospiraceae bacterium]